MKNLPLIFCGIFVTLAFSWIGIVLTSNVQLGALEPVTQQFEKDAETGELVNVPGDTRYPIARVGAAMRGKRVYMDLGCLYCHSQQVRRKGYGSDFERGWGDRQTVARDYIRQERVLLGTMRTGPDLMNVGQRIPTEQWHYLHLYNPRITSDGSIMPPFPFLFERRKIDVTGPSPDALDLSGEWMVGDGYEIVPTQRARDLVAYLLSLRLDYELPEMPFSE